jgi:NYN domain
MTTPKVHLFIDNSNIFISAKDEAQKREGRPARSQVRLQFEHLVELAVAGRELGNVCVVGSIPPEQRAVWDRLEAVTGVRPELFERGELTGGEQGLDQCLQVHMLRAISDHDEPQIVVLMTGDGAGYDDGVGFHADMERMHAAGWGVEVISWGSHCRRALREWATTNGIFVALDDHYEAVTFLEGVRVVKSLDLSKRSLSKPRLSPARAAEERARLQSEAKIAALERQVEELQDAQATKAARKKRHEKRFARGRK